MQIISKYANTEIITNIINSDSKVELYENLEIDKDLIVKKYPEADSYTLTFNDMPNKDGTTSDVCISASIKSDERDLVEIINLLRENRELRSEIRKLKQEVKF